MRWQNHTGHFTSCLQEKVKYRYMFSLMSSGEKTVRLKRVRIIADQLVIEPSRIVIRRPNKEKEEEEAVFEFEEELP